MSRQQPTDFVAFLAANFPDAVAELSDEMHALVARVVESQETGTLTLTVKIKPDPDTGALVVTNEIRARAPQRPRRGLLAHVDPAGNLTTDDPNAFAMFREEHVDPATGEVR